MTTQQKKVDDHEKRLMALEEAIQDIRMLAQAIERHEKILKGGDNDNEKGMLERMRMIENSITGAASWAKAIALLFAAQFVAVIFGVVSVLIKVMPVLIELSKK